MSVVIRDHEDNVRLLVKGADSAILPYLSVGNNQVHQVEHCLNQMAVQGYRTLCLADKKLSGEALQNWLTAYRDAELDFENRREVRIIEA